MQHVSRSARFAPPAIQFPFTFALAGRHKSGWALAALALAFAAAQLAAQQPYAYGANGSGYPAQYAAPPPPSGYAQPPYQQPQYAQPQYNQPQYQQPQYAQPQYNQPQYNQPQYQQPQYQQPQYAQPAGPQQQQPYAEPGQPDAGLPDLGAPESGPAQQPLSAGDLEQLVAPIALYPDNLLAQILAASTYPAQVAAADQWLRGMQSQGYGSPGQIASGAEAQPDWDPSVKGLTAFPQVLDMLNQNLEWTTNLGNAYYNQPQDVMQTVQVLRDRAQQAGNLENTPQQDVSDDQGYIDVAPANPEVVYVPAYNPWDVYGAPIAPYPGFSVLGTLGSIFGAAPIQFGLGIGLEAFEHMPFGWMGWGLSWLTHSILFNHAAYYTHSATVADWGFPHGGARVFGGRGMPGNGYSAGRQYNRGNAYEAARGGNFVRRAYQPGETRGNNGFQPGSGYTHPEMPGQQAYNRMPQQPARPQAYSERPQTYAARPQAYAGGGENYARPGYGYGGAYGYANRPAQSYSGRTQMAYASPYAGYRGPSYQNPSYREPSYREPSYRAPETGSARAFAGRGNEAYGGQFARNGRGGGSHFFGGGRQPEGFGGGRAPKSSRAESFGGGHFSGGGHAPKGFGHEKAPKAGRSGGGHGHFR
ncbi:MAG: DUF3300 domain-containing protein [Terracidiphilus sp.]